MGNPGSETWVQLIREIIRVSLILLLRPLYVHLSFFSAYLLLVTKGAVEAPGGVT